MASPLRRAFRLCVRHTQLLTTSFLSCSARQRLRVSRLFLVGHRPPCTRQAHSETTAPSPSPNTPPLPPLLSSSPSAAGGGAAAPVTVYFHRPLVPPSTFYILSLSSPSSPRALAVRPFPLSSFTFSALRQSPAVVSLITVDHSATGTDPGRFPHPTVFLTTPTRTNERMRWPRAMDVIVEELSELYRPSAADARYLVYALSWMGSGWSQLPRLTPPLSEVSRWHRLGLHFDPSRILLAVLATGAATAYAAAWQREKTQRVQAT